MAIEEKSRSSWPDMEVEEPYGRLARSFGGYLLGELDDQSFRTADIAEPIGVPEVTDLADRVKAFVSQSVDDRVEVIDLDGDMPETQPVRRQGVRALVVGWRMVLDELELTAAVRRSHHHHFRSDAVEPVDFVHSLALDQGPTLTLESQVKEKRSHGVKVIDDNTHMIET